MQQARFAKLRQSTEEISGDVTTDDDAENDHLSIGDMGADSPAALSTDMGLINDSPSYAIINQH